VGQGFFTSLLRCDNLIFNYFLSLWQSHLRGLCSQVGNIIFDYIFVRELLLRSKRPHELVVGKVAL
jgi:hypothetical protein